MSGRAKSTARMKNCRKERKTLKTNKTFNLLSVTFARENHPNFHTESENSVKINVNVDNSPTTLNLTLVFPHLFFPLLSATADVRVALNFTLRRWFFSHLKCPPALFIPRFSIALISSLTFYRVYFESRRRKAKWDANKRDSRAPPSSDGSTQFACIVIEIFFAKNVSPH